MAQLSDYAPGDPMREKYSAGLNSLAPDDPMHGFASQADADALAVSRFQKDLQAVEGYASEVQMANPKERMTGPKPVARQVPVPKSGDPMAGLRCAICKKPAQGFMVAGSFPVARAQSIAERTAEMEARLSETAYGAMDFNDISLATEFGFPADRLQHGLIGGKPGVAQQVPAPKAEPRCLQHLKIAAPAPQKPEEPLGLDALEANGQWTLVGGWDTLFCTVRDKNGTMARISPRDYREHAGAWPGAVA